jgi:tricarballylate dehydrogenase
VLLKHLLDDHGADRIGDPTQAHMVAIDARAPLYDGGICTRIDCVSLGVVVNREANASTTRARTSGPSATPSGAAWWRSSRGRLATRSSTAKAIGRFMPPVFPGVKADTLPELAQKLGLPVDTFMQHAERLQRRLPRGHLRPHRAGRLPHRRRHARQDALGAAHRHRPVLRLRARPGVTFTYLGLHTDDTAAVRFNNEPSPNLFVAGEMMAGNVLGKGYTAGVGMSLAPRLAALPPKRKNKNRPQRLSIKRKLQKQERTMQALEALTRDAKALARGEIVLSAPEAEVARQLRSATPAATAKAFAPCSRP